MAIEKRCAWVGKNQLDKEYHDREWGRPSHDEHYLFEMLMLECQVAGLSWATILTKRDDFRAAFDDFDAHKMAAYDEDKKAELMSNPGIVRNRLKVNAMVSNAKAYLAMLDEGLSINDYFWSFVNGEPIVNTWHDIAQVPAQTELSDAISKDLKKRGFKFVGSVTIYGYLQAVGIVNDHTIDCDARGI